MGGRGSSSGGGRANLGLGSYARKSTVNLRQKVNEALGLTGGRSLAEWGVRKDILSGKSEAQIRMEDKKRLKNINERSKKSSQNGSKSSRYITSSTYERAQKRLKRDVDNWYFGNRR